MKWPLTRTFIRRIIRVEESVYPEVVRWVCFVPNTPVCTTFERRLDPSIEEVHGALTYSSHKRLEQAREVLVGLFDEAFATFKDAPTDDPKRTVGPRIIGVEPFPAANFEPAQVQGGPAPVPDAHLWLQRPVVYEDKPLNKGISPSPSPAGRTVMRRLFAPVRWLWAALKVACLVVGAVVSVQWVDSKSGGWLSSAVVGAKNDALARWTAYRHPETTLGPVGRQLYEGLTNWEDWTCEGEQLIRGRVTVLTTGLSSVLVRMDDKRIDQHLTKSEEKLLYDRAQLAINRHLQKQQEALARELRDRPFRLQRTSQVQDVRSRGTAGALITTDQPGDREDGAVERLLDREREYEQEVLHSIRLGNGIPPRRE